MGIVKNSPLVSIIMPAYNCESYIADSINSVIAQKYTNWELIVIDDNSGDNTQIIIKEIAQYDKRIRHFENSKNEGVSYTRNKGIELALGEWVAFLDSDDLWDELKLQKQIYHATEYKAKFIFSGSKFIDEHGLYYSGIFNVPSKVDFSALKKQNVISCSSVLVRKELFTDIKMEGDFMHEDFAAWLRILKQGIIAYGVNEPLLTYRISKTSKSGNKYKSVGMTYRVFRFIGMGRTESFYFLLRHSFNAYKKYRKIKITN